MTKDKNAAKRFIPASVTKLLANRWNHEEGFSLFTSIFDGRRDRQVRPSWYCYRKGENTFSDFLGGFSGDEGAAMHKEGVFGDHSAQYPSGNVVVNEHASHALDDFLGEVSAAWDRYQTRLAKIPYATPEME